MPPTMPPTPPMPPVPVVPIPPAPPPLTNFWKNLPAILHTIGTGLIPLGAWIQSEVVKNPAFVDTFGDVLANVPGMLAIVSGILINISGVLVSKSNEKATDKIVDHAEAKSDAIAVSAGVMVAEAVNSPAAIPSGQDPIRFRLRLALTEASDLDRYEEAEAILKLIGTIKKKGGAA